MKNFNEKSSGHRQNPSSSQQGDESLSSHDRRHIIDAALFISVKTLPDTSLI